MTAGDGGHAAKYRLPDGTEADEVQYSGDPHGWHEFCHPELGRVRFPGESLQLVPPPPEPPNGTVLLLTWNGQGAPRSAVAYRSDADTRGGQEYRWRLTGSVSQWTWNGITTYGSGMTRLVAPEPITLPWKSEGGFTSVGVGARDLHGLVGDTVEGPDGAVGVVALAPVVARAKAYALLAAADQAEAAS